jgi:parallel beta-helix repeat protein
VKRLVTVALCIGLAVATYSDVDAKKRRQLPLTTVKCAMTVSTSIRLANSLFNCPKEGLFVAAPGLTIDLNGHTIDGNGLDDGPTDEVGITTLGQRDVTVLNGTISRFETGIASSGERATFKSLIVRANTGDGLYIVGSSTRVLSTTADRNGSMGINLLADSAQITGCTANDNSLVGINVIGDDSAIGKNTAHGSTFGVFVFGSRNVITRNRAANSQNGFTIGGSELRVERNVATANTEHGFVLSSARASTISRNIASGNTRAGYYRHPHGGTGQGPLTLTRNTAQNNGLTGFDIVGTDITFQRDRAVDNGMYGFLTYGAGLRLDRVVASGNAYDGVYVQSGNSPSITRSTANGNGFLNGVDDLYGLGINIDPAVVTPVASTNRASGNDAFAAQCTANAACR